MSLTIDEIKEEKKLLQLELKTTLLAFERKTGTRVKALVIDRVETLSQLKGDISYVNVAVEVSV